MSPFGVKSRRVEVDPLVAATAAARTIGKAFPKFWHHHRAVS
jgi:hypothetical protein